MQHSGGTRALVTLPFGPLAVRLPTPAARTAPLFACISHLEGTANICETSEGKLDVFKKHIVHTILILVFQPPPPINFIINSGRNLKLSFQDVCPHILGTVEVKGTPHHDPCSVTLFGCH